MELYVLLRKDLQFCGNFFSFQGAKREAEVLMGMQLNEEEQPGDFIPTWHLKSGTGASDFHYKVQRHAVRD